MLNEFQAGDKIRHIVLFRIQKIGTSSNGGVFARGNVSDNSATWPFVCFDNYTVELLRELTGPKAFLTTGTIDVNRYANDGSLQLMVQKVEEPLATDDLSHLLPDGGVSLKKYEQKLTTLIESINDQAVRSLLEKVFSGQNYYSFKTNPAAMTYHHAYLGGLLEHSVDVAELALSMGERVKNVDMDIIIAGALLHDIGKLKEISQDVGFPYTEEGKFVGHISLGAMMVNEYAAELQPPFKGGKLDELLHVILSHHGEMEKGSPVSCKTKEAFIVHYADELDSIMNQFRQLEGKGWQFNKMLNRGIYAGGID